MNGEELWRLDLGAMDSGWFFDKSYQWGHSSSPVIFEDRVIVQVDVQSNSHIAAYSLEDGKQLWKTAREGEIPTWGTPTVYTGGRPEVITNGTKLRGYDAMTGEELWTLGPNSEVTVATPIIHGDKFIVTAGYPPIRPIYVIKAGSKGDLSLEEGAESSDSIPWMKSSGGTYMPTPIVYGDYLYTCANDGRLTCYKADTGERVYRARISGRPSFTASPVASDGRLYFPSEEGIVHVIKAGPKFEEIVKNEVGEIIQATPAISDGMMIIRSQNHVIAVADMQTN
jgi:outer membrane protein assembly factor BamB